MTAQNNWAAIRRHYATVKEQINSTPRDEWAIDPYMWDFGQGMIFMTPIEENFWADCREADLILYPQYPACGYFMDFANPVAMVGIECDGKAYHMDKARDAAREDVLVNRGWKIYRIQGWQCNQDWDEETGVPPYGRELADEIGKSHGIRRNPPISRGPVSVGELLTEWVERQRLSHI